MYETSPGHSAPRQPLRDPEPLDGFVLLLLGVLVIILKNKQSREKEVGLHCVIINAEQIGVQSGCFDCGLVGFLGVLFSHDIM